MREKQPYQLQSGWKRSSLPPEKMTGCRPPRNPGGKEMAIMKLLYAFDATGDKCWRKDYPPSFEGSNYSNMADADQQAISKVCKLAGIGIKVKRRGCSLFLVRE